MVVTSTNPLQVPIKEEWMGNLPACWNGSFGRSEYHFKYMYMYKYMAPVLEWADGLKVVLVWCPQFMTPH